MPSALGMWFCLRHQWCHLLVVGGGEVLEVKCVKNLTPVELAGRVVVVGWSGLKL